MAHAATTNFAFHCSSCGKCCNSPPLLALPELFRFQDVFIGCLAVRRICSANQPARAALFDTLAFRAPGPSGATHVSIMPQGYFYDSVPHCPALQTDARCSLHACGKPTQCAAVPLDPLVPDQHQSAVLAERTFDSIWQQAACITQRKDAEQNWLTENGAVTDPTYASALGTRRAAMAADRQIWGRAVFDMLRADWLATDAALTSVGVGGFVALPMAPALIVLAGFSDAYRIRCLSFLQAQLRLIETAVSDALARQRTEDRATTHRLRAWAKSYRALQATLTQRPATYAAPAAISPLQIEAWLNPAPHPA